MVACSIPDEGINHSGRTMTLGSTHSVTEMSTSSVIWEGKGGRCLGLTTLPPSYADCSKFWESLTLTIFKACPGLYMGFKQLVFILPLEWQSLTSKN